MRVLDVGGGLVQVTWYPRVFPVNSYLVREEDGFTLVDTGLSGGAGGIVEAARGLGGEIRRIVLTHAHADHAGSLDGLRKTLPEAQVSVSVREARLLGGEMGLEAGEPREKLRGGWRKCQTRPDSLLSSGDSVESLEVIPSPGHTPGHLSLLDRRDGTLICGDAFQTRGGVAVAGSLRPLFPFPALATWHEPTALESARTLRALDPARLAVGHGPVLEDPLAQMDRAISVSERRVGRRERR